MAKPKDLYVVWKDDEDEQFYNQYFTLEDAAAEEGEEAEIFKASLTSLGSFYLVVQKKLVKNKKAKAAKRSKK